LIFKLDFVVNSLSVTSSPTGYPQVVADVVNGQIRRTYTYGLERISELQMVNGAPTASFYQYDGRGTVRLLTNSAGAVTDSYEYDAFGNLIASTGSTPNAYLYRGERYDADLGLYYLRARWYNPVTGRFMTRDPDSGSIYDPASLHRYNYGRANPVNYIDPSGRASMSDYALLLTNSVAQAAVVAALGRAVSCALYAEASAIHLVGMHIDEDITQMSLLFQSCAAKITVQQIAQDTAYNLLFMGAFSMLGKGIGWLLEDAAEGAVPRLAPYGEMKGTLPEGFQANHLNQNAAYRDVIPTNEGLANSMEGNAITEPGTPHYDFHNSMEQFWDQYRRGGENFGLTPTNGEYGIALQQALEDAGYSAEDAANLTEQAAQQQIQYGLTESDPVPRIPGLIYQVPR